MREPDVTVRGPADERPSVAQTLAQETRPSSGGSGYLPQDFGPYRILEQLEGGMGIVYVAEQTAPISRRVAIKVMKWGSDSPEMLARFDAERRLLALLNHPNIAQIYEAEATADGRPFFVMEYVDGAPITTYCDERLLSVEDRLRLFQQVCHGVQQAHQKGIIHRDLKPSNILVTEIDGRPVPKIIDFGIAKIIDSTVSGSARTRVGEMLGTPEYASPEQVAMSPLDLDTRSDVYSLGVICYELLTGVLPFDLSRDERSWAEILDVIRTIDPSPPSVRTGGGPRELDWIVMRALEKEPSRRYQSPAAFADDIERFLNHEAVSAGPPSRTYRLRKLVRRHVAAFVTIAAVLLTLVVTGTLSGIRIKKERDEARRQAVRAEAMNQFLLSLFDAADPYAPDANPIDVEASAKLIRRGIQRMDGELATQPDIHAEMLTRLGELYLNMNFYKEAEEILARAYSETTRLYGPDGIPTLRAQRYLGRALFRLSKYEEADKVLTDSLDRIRRIEGAAPVDVAETLRSLGRVRRVRGDLTAAERLYEESLRLWRAARGDNDIDYGSTLGDLAALKKEMGKKEEAIALQRRTIAIFRSNFGPKHPEVAINLNNLGVYLGKEHAVEAEAVIREALAIKLSWFDPHSVEVSPVMSNLARALLDQNKLAEARPIAEGAVADGTKNWGPAHERTARARLVLGRVCIAQRDVACAQEQLDAAVEVYRSKVGPDAPRTAEAELPLASLLLMTGRGSEARTLLSHASRVLLAEYPPTHPAVLELHQLESNLAAAPK